MDLKYNLGLYLLRTERILFSFNQFELNMKSWNKGV